MGNEPGNSQKSETQGQKIYSSVSKQQENMNKLWKSNSSESAAWTLLPLRIVKKVVLCVTAESHNNRSTGYITWAD